MEFRRSGEGYLQREQYPQAVAVLKKAFRLAEPNPALADLLVHACRLANRPQAAAEVFFAISSRLAASGDAKGAHQMFSRGVAENSGGTLRKVRLAQWSLQLGKRDQAADLFLELADFWGNKLDLVRAYRFLGAARNIRNGPKAALVEMRILTLSGRHGDALSLARKALVRFPQHAGLQVWLAARDQQAEPPPGISQVPVGNVLPRLRGNLLQARTWFTHGYVGRAMSLIQRMLLAEPGFIPALDLAEQIHRESGDLIRFQRLGLACAQRLANQGRNLEALALFDRIETLFPGATTAFRGTLS